MAELPRNVYTQPYDEALRERMQWFEQSGQAESGNGEDDSDDDEDLVDYYGYGGSDVEETHPEAVTQRDRLLALRCDAGQLVGTSLSACEVMRCPLPERLSVLLLRGQVADALVVPVRTVTLLTGGRSMADSEIVDDLEGVIAKQLIEQTTVFVCERPARAREVSLGEASIKVSLPSVDLLQAVQEPLEFVTGDHDQCWLVYWKERVQAARYATRTHSREFPPRSPLLRTLGTFPAPPLWPLPPGTRRWGRRCDVWSTSAQIPVAALLDEHAARTNDCPIPRYQMIVDPNQFVHEGEDDITWVACEADVDAYGSVRLVGGERSHAEPELARKVAAPVLEAALPLLAQLERPRLLLDQRRLQFVFKAQRIIVPPDTGDGADAEYIGLWHVDGRAESVVAVVLYYYRVHPCLLGGDMEFCGREPFDVLGWGDCKCNNADLNAARLHHALRGEDRSVRTCTVPIKEGTLLVFSNYQMVHRVLRMVNSSADEEASRDFVALFVIDPAAEPLLPARMHLASSYLAGRTLRGVSCLGARAVQEILEFLGEVPSLAYKRRRRAELLREQLKPQGRFLGNDSVYGTGNGCFTMIGWVDRLLEMGHDSSFEEKNPNGWKRFRALDLPPQKLGRGMSEVLSLDSQKLKERRGRDPAAAIDELAIDGEVKTPPQPPKPSSKPSSSAVEPWPEPRRKRKQRKGKK